MYLNALQVVSSIQRTSPSIDHDLLQQARSVKYRHGPAHYCMLRGKLFSAIPAALAFVVRFLDPNACPLLPRHLMQPFLMICWHTG